MPKKKKVKNTAETITASIAAEISSSVKDSRKGRDSLTRVMSPIKGADTKARQWNRWSP